MKIDRLYLLIFCLLVATASCKKDSTTKPQTSQTDASLFSKWELRNQSGGLRPDVNYAPGNGNILQFNLDNTYIHFIGNAVSQRGVFQIKEQTSQTEPEKFKYIYYDMETAGYPLVIRHDTLIIGNNAADGIESMYIKKQ